MKLPSSSQKRISFGMKPSASRPLTRDALMTASQGSAEAASILWLKSFVANAKAIVEEFHRESQALLATEQKHQQRILQLYQNQAGVVQSLTQFFQRINQESVAYQSHALNNAMAIINQGSLPANCLRGIGDNCYEYATGGCLFDAPTQIDVVHNPGYTVLPGHWLVPIENGTKLAYSQHCSRLTDQSKQLLVSLYQKVRQAYCPDQNGDLHLTQYLSAGDWRCMMQFDALFAGRTIVALNDFDRNTYRPKPNTILFAGVYYDGDYHFYRYNPGINLWTHKRGWTPVAATDDSGNLIFDPKTCDRGDYRYFMGYFELS